MFYANNATEKKSMEEVWYLDSGCSNHMTGREDVLIDIDRNVTAKVAMGTGQLVDVIGKGSLMVETKMGRKYIKEVLLVSGLKENLLSVGQMMEHGYFLIFGDNKAEVYDDSSPSNLVARVHMKGNRSFPLKLQTDLHVALTASINQLTLLWHRRMGHLNFQSLKLLQNEDMVFGLPEIKNTNAVCEGCTFGKQCRKAFPKEANSRATTPLKLVHTDVCGPMQIVTKAGNRYFLTFIDDCTRMCWIYFLRCKSEVFTVFKRFRATVELQSGYKVKKLRSDRGGEYTSHEFNKLCDEMGMERQLTVAYSPQQNGVAERKNRTIVEMAKCMMIEKGMPLEFWAKTVNTTVYVLNRSPTKALDKKTPFEAYSGRKPGLKHLRVFGSLCSAHVPNPQRQKLDLASNRCAFLGYGSCEKGYRLYNIATKKVIISSDVVFNEEASWDWNAQQECSVSVPLTEVMSEKEEGSNDTIVKQAEHSVENELLTEDNEERSVVDTDICNLYLKLLKPFQTPRNDSQECLDSSERATLEEVSGTQDTTPPVLGGGVNSCYGNGADSPLDFEYDTRLLSSLAEIFKSSLFAKKPQESVSLYKCLEAFLKEEPLGPEDVVSGCILILLNLALKYFVLYTPMIWKS
ncbi:hypothetical protein L3X38_010574 [Prunus dulcis]|uniref:Integrase catalytic domain-containing protein n=1 Tax=Prunus dulcis TaxID=3755 RepID=A0AAD4ZEV9_PRUDU|nr:hypothetical protein L3X38_010574 [Prunus dulcis]